MVVYFNGKFIDKSAVAISPDDRGFLFADGIYEVIRWYGTYFFGFREHMDRMQRSLHEIRLDFDAQPDFSVLARELVRLNHLETKNALLYMQITRGSAKRTHGFPVPPVAPTVYVNITEAPPSSEDGESGISVITLPDERWGRCDIKTVGLLANVLAKQKAIEQGAHEAFLIRDGKITEGAHSNVFAVRHNTVVTHPDSRFILPGIIRKITLGLCEKTKIPVELTPIPENELAQMNEFFITNTSGEIVAVTVLNHKPVSNGKPGSLTRKLQKAFCDYREKRRS